VPWREVSLVAAKGRSLVLTAYLRFVRAFSARRRLEGIDVYVFQGDGSERDVIFSKTAGALELIRRHDSKSLKRLLEGFDYLLVINGMSALASASVRQRVCRVQHDYVLDQDTSDLRLASTLVHEGAHAHIFRRGVGYRPDLRKRVEDVCVSAEFAFLRRGPRWEPALARQTIGARSYSAQVSSDEALLSAQVEALRNLGAPDRVIRWFEKRRLSKVRDRHGT
jgi:hypothetical protein